ncbi:MAG: MFS transporter [Promethearchaeota archaeon]
MTSTEGIQIKFRVSPIIVSEIMRTGSSALMGIAIVNYLTFEVRFSSWIIGIIAAIYSAGFFTFNLGFSSFINRFKRKTILSFVSLVITACSFGYLIPISDLVSLIVFCVFRFFEGGVTGIFWSTVQSYSRYMAEISQDYRNRYISRYNAGFNVGIIVGTIIGWSATYMFRTNLLGFYINIILVLVQLFLILFVLRELPPSNGECNRSGHVKADNDLTSQGEDLDKRTLSTLELKTIKSLSIFMVFLALLTHSFSDGAMKVFIPEKLFIISSTSYMSYLIFFEKSISQTITITVGAHIPENWIVRLLIFLPVVIGAGWLIVGFHSSVVVMSFGFIMLGGVQGVLYSAGMRFLTNVSHQQRDSRIFTFYQVTMGGGRMIGPFILGFLLEFGLNVAFLSIIFFDVLVFSILLADFTSKNRIKN